ncbi:hypothetical protein ABUK73_00670 [Agrobacterium sp. BA1120]|uniref:hypothetical protein n=1 Tax=Agrobacterium sp. BA1120 TaxID=3228927 RepID=UPI00336A702F
MADDNLRALSAVQETPIRLILSAKLLTRMQPRLFSIAFIQADGNPASGNDTHRQGDIEEEFHSSHDLNPPRVRLANKFYTTAAESQITVPIVVLMDSPGEPGMWLAILKQREQSGQQPRKRWTLDQENSPEVWFAHCV